MAQPRRHRAGHRLHAARAGTPPTWCASSKASTAPCRCTRELRLRFDYGRVVPWVRHHGDRMEAIAGPDRVRLRTPAPTAGTRAVHRLGLHRPRRGPGPVRAHLEPQPRTAAQAGRRRGRAARHPHLLDATGPPAAPRCTGRYRRRHQAVPAHPQGADLPAHRRDRRRRHHLAARADRRTPQLGLPLLLAARLHLHPAGAASPPATSTEAKAWREWLLRAVAGDPADLQIMYALDGTRRLPEAELPWLAGYENSTPVRTGNAASDQLQLDVWGETLDGLAPGPQLRHQRPRRRLGPAGRAAWSTSRATGTSPTTDCGRCAAPAGTSPTPRSWPGSRPTGWPPPCAPTRPARARRPVGSAARHHPRRRPGPRLRRRPQHLHPVLRRARPGRQPAHDPPRRLPAAHRPARAGHHRRDPERPHRGRLRQALRHHRLRRRAHRRRRAVPGLLVLARRRPAPRRPAAARPPSCSSGCSSLRNDVGLLSEEWDPKARRQLGNTPQAFSHFPLVTSALQLHAGKAHRSNQPIAPSPAPTP